MKFWRTKKNPVIRLSSPTVAILDLVGEQVVELVNEDQQLLSRLFNKVHYVTRDAPTCDVMFLYARITADGGIVGWNGGLRELIRDSGAKIVVVASENPGPAYVKAGAGKPYGQANLVMTIARNGSAFGQFFAALFSQMNRGVSMPEAWVQLSPQRPGSGSAEQPSTIFACELGQLTFR